MSNIQYDLKKIKAFAFDVDGVLSKDVMPLHPNGDPMRITGGNTEAVRLRYER
jgi:3-deoxy-D-manno-octulosonate 8-phosphate phosphatase (KDO 8-P phosphatase)